MGLFSSKTIVTVSTSATRVIEDKVLPNAVKTGVLKDLISSDNQLVENVMEEMAASIAIKANRMYRYGKTKYIHGVPKMAIRSSHTGESVTKAVLEELEANNTARHSIQMQYFHVGAYNKIHHAWETLVRDYGYDVATNELTLLSAQKGAAVALEDIQVVLPPGKIEVTNPIALEQWAIQPDLPWMVSLVSSSSSFTARMRPKTLAPILVDAGVTTEEIRVIALWEGRVAVQENGVTVWRSQLQREVITIPLQVESPDADFVMACYYYEQPYGLPWESLVDGILKINQPTKQITKFFTYRVGSGTYPEIDGVYLDVYPNLGSFFPIGYLRFNKQPITAENNPEEYAAGRKLLKYLGMEYNDVVAAIDENPDIGKVERATLMMGVPFQSEHPLEMRYLFDFFKQIYTEAGGAAGGVTRPYGFFSKMSPLTATTVTITDKKSDINLVFNGLQRKIRAGKLGVVGSYHRATSQENETVSYDVVDIGGNPSTDSYTERVTYHFLRKQVSENVYEEYRFRWMEAKYQVSGGHYSTSNDSPTALLIPLDYSITSKYGAQDREELYARSLHFLFHAKQETEVKWYQQDWFQMVMIVVAVAITFFSMGSGGGSTLGLLVSSGQYAAAAVLILANIVSFVLMQAAFKLFVKAVGAEAAMVFALVLAAYVGYESFNAGSVAGAPWANELLSVSNGLVSAAQDSIQDAMLGLKEEAEAFGLAIEEKYDALEEKKSLLESHSWLSPVTIFGESRDEFLNRTIHSGNVGSLAIDAIHNYVDFSLTLPKPMFHTFNGSLI